VTTIPRETARSGRSAVVSRVGPVTHALLRIGVALLFMQHGVQKLFGLFGGVGPTPGGTVTLWSRMGLAGVLETFGGLLLLGLFTRPVAFLVAGEMLVAFFQVPVAKGGVPLQNGGEVPLLYMLVFLFLLGNGAGPASLDGRRRRA
jgi:putative oxidoreductase